MDKLIDYLLEAWDSGGNRGGLIIGILALLILLAALPYGLFLFSEPFRTLFDNGQKVEVFKGLLGISQISAISAFFLFLLLSLVRGKKSKNDFEEFAQEIEETLRESCSIKFNKLYKTTESDRNAGFLRADGKSFFMKARKTDESGTEYKGVWIVNDNREIKSLFLSFDGETNWIFDLGDDIKKFPEYVERIAHDTEGKIEITHENKTISKWKEAESYKDIFQ